MRLPKARGVISEAVITRLRGGTSKLDDLKPQPAADPTEVILDDDLQLGLWLLYELHYRGFDDVDDAAEWDPSILHVRRELERPFETALHRLTAAGIERAKARSDDVRGPAGRGDRGRRRPVAGRLPASRRRNGTGRGVPDPALDLSPQGGRPAHLCAAPADGTGQGRAGRAAVRRARLRPAGVAAQRAVRADAARGWPGPHVRDLSRGRAQLHLGRQQRDVPFRPASATPRRGDGTPGGVRSHQLVAVPPHLPGLWSDWATARTSSSISTNTSRPMPSTNTWPRRGSARPWWPPSRTCSTPCCSAPPVASSSTGSLPSS